LSNSDLPSRRIQLKQGRDAPIRKRHHPWIYSQAVEQAITDPLVAELLPVFAADGSPLGWGYYSPGSLIAVRMVSFRPERPADDWICQRIRDAWRLRESLHIDSDAVRLVNSEGDSVPGLVIDRYAEALVLSVHARGIESEKERILSCLREMFPAASVYLRRDEHYGRVEKLGLLSGYLVGNGDGTSVIREGAVKLVVDFERGQKTGFYLDQRENRGLIAAAGRGRRVLNLFSYTGAVALRAVAAGAEKVISVESSRKALDTAKDSVRLNPDLRAEAFEWVPEDVFSYLEDPPPCDVVVADPPPFARRRSELQGAIKGYLSLFQQCIRILSPGGVAFLFSCSGAVDRPTFQQVVMEAALQSGRTVRLLRELHADVDHPVSANHPEGEYLKGWMVHAQ
jgi:23S rRNA (cytosine1962-C5)-methyltransferase